ncbi:SDR family NAD(P)-dependent oxidoreductase [Paraglaciecola polaris]|uniref:SDR family NAD(P)-dependent oxidoreductase n=1 Tax=Paraglaciecola polaris TaxID=222814 RepID=UPI0030EE9F9B|tara:strand:+ start:12565 stop:13326 length:762 start_codon:yes stop_codon:yes gene_type:complete
MEHNGNALVIGVSGGIGREVFRQLVESERYKTVIGVSRQVRQQAGGDISSFVKGAQLIQLDYGDESVVADFCQAQQSAGQFTRVICCCGVLHGQSRDGTDLQPEKRLEDMSADKLSAYFSTNTILPALWLRYLLPLVTGHKPADISFCSARVGSIQDNRLGGWYGYRASKAALNMLVKTAQVEYQRRAKNVAFICYHPGTVDTSLSKPFQGNVQPDKLFTSEFSVGRLLGLLASVCPEKGPYFIDWDGKAIPW